MATGRVNVGGGGGVRKLYRLLKQLEEPANPKKGDIWVKPIKQSSKTTLSINEPMDHVAQDGELFLQFTHVVQQFNFTEITSKIDGNLNATEFIYDITTLKTQQLTDYFIPLFQKDVVKQSAILTRIVQYVTDEWLYPESYYYDGSRWVAMNYKFYIGNNSGQIMKYTDDLIHAQTLDGINSHLIRVMPNGDFYTQSITVNVGFNIKKFNSNGELLSQLTLPYSLNVACVVHIDDYERIYTIRSIDTMTQPAFGLSDRLRYFSVYDNTGELLMEISNIGQGMYFYPEVHGIDELYNKIYMSAVYSSNYRNLVIDMSDLTHEFSDQIYGESHVRSNYIFDGEFIYYLSDRSSSATLEFYLFKRRRDDYSVVSFAYSRANPDTTGSSDGLKYIKGMRNGQTQNKYYLTKIDDETFVVHYNYQQTVSSINKLIVDFDLGYPLYSEYMNDVLISTVGLPSQSAGTYAFRKNDNFIICQRALLMKYSLSNGLLVDSQTLESGIFYLASHFAKSSAPFKYGIG